MFALTACIGGYPAKKEAPDALNDEGLTANTNGLDCATAHHFGKQYDNLRAKAALAGHCLERHGKVLTISRWGHSREFDSLATAAAWVDRIGGQIHV